MAICFLNGLPFSGQFLSGIETIARVRECVCVFGFLLFHLIHLPFQMVYTHILDTILADIIDYDEFLTGSRTEATYTMFKSFLPKIAAIPASTIPVALLPVFGHVQPVQGASSQSLC